MTQVLCYAQSNKKINTRADLLEYDEGFLPGAQRLLGHVVFQHENTTGYCDSAYYYEDDNYLIAFGKPVRILIGDSVRLYGKKAYYSGNEKTASIARNVEMVHGVSHLYSDSLIYDLGTDVGYYLTGGTMINVEDTLSSKVGHYYTKTDEVWLQDSVLLQSSSYMMDCDTLLYNTEFSKEFPSEYKKLMGENLTKNLSKLFKDNNTLGKYIDYAHERVISNLKTLINNYEVNYKTIHQYLLRRRRECQEYYLLNDDDLILLIELKDSYEIRELLLKKIFPYIKEINPGKENEEKLTMTTKIFDEKVTLKYAKASRALKDGIECVQLGMNKKIKDFLKSFK